MILYAHVQSHRTSWSRAGSMWDQPGLAVSLGTYQNRAGGLADQPQGNWAPGRYILALYPTPLGSPTYRSLRPTRSAGHSFATSAFGISLPVPMAPGWGCTCGTWDTGALRLPAPGALTPRGSMTSVHPHRGPGASLSLSTVPAVAGLQDSSGPDATRGLALASGPAAYAHMDPKGFTIFGA
jgi:hypothetical protein